MKKTIQLIVFLLLTGVQLGLAQKREVSGTVTDAADGSPLPGVTVVVKGTNVGTSTDVKGHYVLKNVEADAVLVFSFVGMKKQEINSGMRKVIDVKMEQETERLEQVVVTALGIKRQKRDLGYSTVNVTNRELVKARALNVAVGLQGKVPGLNITGLNSSVFEDVKINLRGIRSLTGDNNPMLLLDGVPVALGFLSSLNPNDIESVNVLKGTSAAAIYGPDARNGVIVVTTKVGAEGAKPEITISNSTQFSQVSMFPKFQTEFGSGGYGDYIPYENWSYGPAYDGSEVVLGETLPDGSVQKVKYSPIKNNRRKFFKTGMTMQNDVSYLAKDFFLSVQDALIKGVVPNDRNRRTGIRLNASKTYKIFTVNFNSNYIQSNYDVFDDTAMSDYYSANNVGLNDGLMNLIFSTQAHVPLTSYKDYKNNAFATYDNYYNRYGINPYIALDTWRRKGKKQDLITSIDFKLSPTGWWDINYRAAMTYRTEQYKVKTLLRTVTEYGEHRGISTIPQRVEDYSYVQNRLSSELYMNFHKTLGDFKGNLLVGTYVRDVDTKSMNMIGDRLIVEDLFNVSARPGELTGGSDKYRVRMLSFYGSLTLNYKNFVNLEVTGRNDKTSVLDPKHNSFFYPGVSASVVLTDAIPAIKSDVFNFFKLRASWNKTGNADIDPYLLSATSAQILGFPYAGLPGYSINSTSYDPLLKPEFVKSIEFGFEASLLDNRVTLDMTYYNQKNTNQIVRVRVPRSTGYSFAYLNAASFKNFGFEAQLKLTPLVRFGEWDFNLGTSFTYNDSKVLSIFGDLEELSVGGFYAASNQAVVGKPAFVFSAKDYQRDPEGRVIVDAGTGLPKVDETNKIFGRTMPKYIMGLNPTITWRGLTISATFEYKGGYYAFNMIGADMAWTGVSERTGANHRERFVFPNSVYEDPKNPGKYIPNENVTITDVNDFWTGDNYRTVGTNFLTSADSWRFREFSISYDLPQSLIGKQNVIKGVTIAFTGRNLALWLPKSNVYGDPDFQGSYFSDQRNVSGVGDATVNPPTRSFGGTITVKF